MKLRHVISALCYSVAVLVLFSCYADAQSAPTIQTSTVPTHILYRHFLAYQLHLDRVSDDLTKKGKNGDDFRNHYQKKLAFTDADYAKVRAAAAKMQKDIATVDAKATAVIDAYRKANPPVMKEAKPLPPPPTELTTLQQERDQIIKDDVAALQQALGPKAATLDALIQGEFAKNVNITFMPHSVDQHAKAPAFSSKGVQ